MSAPKRSTVSTSREQSAVAGPAASSVHVTNPIQIEQGLIIELVSDNHGHRWTRAELEHELAEVEPTVLRDALERLKLMDVVHLDGELVWASRCARYMYAIDLVML